MDKSSSLVVLANYNISDDIMTELLRDGVYKAELWLMSLTLASFERLHGVDSKNDDDEVSAETTTQMHLVR